MNKWSNVDEAKLNELEKLSQINENYSKKRGEILGFYKDPECLGCLFYGYVFDVKYENSKDSKQGAELVISDILYKEKLKKYFEKPEELIGKNVECYEGYHFMDGEWYIEAFTILF